MTPDAALWPRHRGAELVDLLARRAGLRPAPAALPPSTSGPLEPWLSAAADRLEIELEPVKTSWGELPELLRRAGPAILVWPDGSLLGLLGNKGDRLQLLGPDLKLHSLPLAIVRDGLSAGVEAPVRPMVEAVMDAARVPEGRRDGLRRSLLRARLSERPLDLCFLLRTAPQAGFRRHLAEGRLHRPLIGLLLAHGLQYGLYLFGWWLLGRGALSGQLDGGWLIAWALVLLTTVPLRMAATWAQGRIGVGVGARLKQRLLVGALRLPPEAVRKEGMGALLGRVVESEAVEALALGAGFAALTAIVDLSMAGFVLSQGFGGGLLLPLLLGWWGIALALGLHFHKRHHGWTAERRSLTHALVERMVGHRTRLAQEPPSAWHEDEDRALVGYAERSARFDGARVALQAGLGRGWLVLAFGALAVLTLGERPEMGPMAVALGGVLLSRQALGSLGQGMVALSGVAVAWEQVGALFKAASTPVRPGAPSSLHLLGAPSRPEKESAALVEAAQLRFGYPGRARPVIDGIDLRIQRGDRLLLEGPSGGGKSTLASLLVGLREPEAGLLLLQGLDRPTLGDHRWRGVAVSAPQFHENRVIVGTFAFNLLMGRRWPPEPGDLEEAEALCLDLGLGPLLERMPAGLQQMVGERGWQLSHGEKSRLYLARALLQHADLVVLDESFAALDPESLARSLRSVLDRAPTLLVIAHP